MIIRPEQIDDYEGISEVIRLAFGRDNEANLVERLRDEPDFHPGLSLVAVDSDVIVGYILFSPIVIKSEKKQQSALALAPLAVRPGRQQQGIGAELIEQGVRVCHKLGHRIIIVLGDPEYYSRFGFQPASRFAIYCPFPVPDQNFMALGLGRGVLKTVQGNVVYPEAFYKI